MGDSKKYRLAALALFALAWVAAIWVRLFVLQIVDYRELTQRALHQRQRTIEVRPRRGNIYDRNFHELAMSVQMDSVFAAPGEISNKDTVVALLAPVLQMEPEALRLRLANGKAFSFLKRKVEPQEAEHVRRLNLKGIYLQKENQRFYPKNELAAHLIGFVTTEQDGMAGLESRFDRQVKGRKGRMLVQADARHHLFGRRLETEPAPGDNLVLTIDEKIQFIAERELATAMEHTHAQAGTVLVMNPNNGEILAMANQPTFNPNARQEAKPEVWLNRGVNAVFEPGSTMKIITIASAIEEGLTQPEEMIDCQMGAINVFGRIVHDHKPFGMLSVSQIMAYSSDVGSIKLGLRLGNERFYRYIRNFGLGSKTGIELPGEEGGLARSPERWNKSSIGSIAMGQELAATPLQMAAATSVIAAGGVWHRPRVVRGRFSPGATTASSAMNPTVLAADNRSEDTRRVVSEETALKIRNMLEMVVTNGTGKTARLNGYTSAGKSGTAQKYDPAIGTYSPTNYVASYIGFAPATAPAVTIAVILDSPVGAHHGGEVSGPVFKRIAEQVLPYLETPRDLPLNEESVRRAEKIDPAQLRDFTDETVVSESAVEAVAVDSLIDGTAVVDLEGSLVAPDFTGKTARVIAEIALARGLDVNLVGSGVARQQSPAPGGRLLPGRRITIKFSR